MNQGSNKSTEQPGSQSIFIRHRLRTFPTIAAFRAIAASWLWLAAPCVYAQEAAASLAPMPTASELESRGTVIGDIHVIGANIFDTTIPEDDKSIFRLANRLHVRTGADVIRSQLLVKSGDPFKLALLRESERILRSNDYLYDADIVPVNYRDGKVDLEVHTRDVWTLKPGISFSRSGGANSTRFEIEESNLFGRGKDIDVEHNSDVDRDSTRLQYNDPHVWGSWYQFSGAYSQNSDGRLRSLSLLHPFYSLDTRVAGSVGAIDWNRIDSRYDRGKVIDQFRHSEENVEFWLGHSNGVIGGNAWRWTYGMAYESDRFARSVGSTPGILLPEDRRLGYPFVDVTMIQDRFEERHNEQQIDRTEDLYSGSLLRARVGWATSILGSDRSAALITIEGARTFEMGPRNTLLLSAAANGRLEDLSLRNGSLSMGAQYLWRTAAKQLFYAALNTTITHRLDAENQLLLGGDKATSIYPLQFANYGSAENRLLIGPDNTLRGYPLRYQDGSSLALLTLEHRIYTGWYLFRLFHVGGAAFFDMGRTWGRGNGAMANEGTLKDVGIGLRLGQSRSAFGNVIHVDLAFPLNGDSSINKMQFLVQTKHSF